MLSSLTDTTDLSKSLLYRYLGDNAPADISLCIRQGQMSFNISEIPSIIVTFFEGFSVTRLKRVSRTG